MLRGWFVSAYAGGPVNRGNYHLRDGIMDKNTLVFKMYASYRFIAFGSISVMNYNNNNNNNNFAVSPMLA